MSEVTTDELDLLAGLSEFPAIVLVKFEMAEGSTELVNSDIVVSIDLSPDFGGMHDSEKASEDGSDSISRIPSK